MATQDLEVPSPTPNEVDAQVKKSLEGTPFEASALIRLHGGSVNWTYAATLATPLEDGTLEVMVKHAEMRMKERPDTILTLERSSREGECFKRLNEAEFTGETNLEDSLSITVRTPKYFGFYEESSNQLMEFMPKGINLKDYMLKYYATPTSKLLEREAREIGKSMGSWLKGFTSWSASQDELRSMARKNVEGQFFRHMVSFAWLKDRADQYPAILGDVKQVLAEVEHSVAAELKDIERLQPIHGDFWTGNILLPDEPISEDGQGTTMFVIDWEMLHMNVPNVDLGQMIAELYTIWLFRSIPAGLWVLEALVEAYGEVTEEFAFRTALQVGSHLVCVICELNWGSSEQIERVLALGRDIILHAWNKDRTWFEGSELACIFLQAK